MYLCGHGSKKIVHDILKIMFVVQIVTHPPQIEYVFGDWIKFILTSEKFPFWKFFIFVTLQEPRAARKFQFS